MREKEMEASDKERRLNATSRPTAAASGRQASAKFAKDRKAKRPDKVLYVPRGARRHVDTLDNKLSGEEDVEKAVDSNISKSEMEIFNENCGNKVSEEEQKSDTNLEQSNLDMEKFNDVVLCKENKKRPCKDDTSVFYDQKITKVQNNDQVRLCSIETSDDSSDVKILQPESSNQGNLNENESSSLPSENITMPVEQELPKNTDVESEALVLSKLNEVASTSAVNTARESGPTAVKSIDIANSNKAKKTKKKLCESTSRDDSWDVKFDDNGDCLDPSILEELTDKVGKVAIAVPEIDYFTLETKEPEINDEVFGHILEIYNFPIEYKTQDLISAFHLFKDRGFSIKWVDDTHALVIFGSRLVAEEAVHMQHPVVKTRPLAQATIASKRKAKHCSEFLQPYKERPQTSTIMVHRLLSGALGVQLPISKQKRDAEGKKLKDAIERKKVAKKQRDDAWEGVLGNSD